MLAGGLRLASVRALAAVPPTGTVPPVALLIHLDSGARLTDPETLIRTTVTVTAVTHPLLDTLLLRAGAQLDGVTYTLTDRQAVAPAPGLVAALQAAHPASWRSRGRSELRDHLGARLVQHLTAAGVAPTTRRPKRLASTAMLVSRDGSRLRLTPTAAGLQLAGHRLEVGPDAALHLCPDTAAQVVDAARAAGLVVIDADRSGRLDKLTQLMSRSCLVLPVPGAPAWAEIRLGAQVNALKAGVMPAGQALEVVRKARSQAAVAVHPDVTAAAAVHRAAHGTGEHLPAVVGVPADVGLRPWQAAFVSAYRHAAGGLVNALPPGAGKTVCAAAAMQSQAAGQQGPYRAVVLAPATLRSQWHTELGRFFPAARVHVLESATALAAAQRADSDWFTSTGPVVLILTAHLLASVTADADLVGVLGHLGDLVVDEGVYLRNPTSAQSAAAWALRAHSDRAMVLTGTPDDRGVDDVGALLSFARNDPSLFAQHPLSGPHPQVHGDRVGAWVFTGPETVGRNLPEATPVAVTLTAGEDELKIDAIARDRISALLARPGRVPMPKLRSELEGWRLGLASPAALLRSKFALGAAAIEAGVAGAPGTKQAWMLDRIRGIRDTGGQVLVFSDFGSALDDLRADLEHDSISCGVVSSAVSAKKRAELVDKFTAGDVAVLLVAATGQLGLNLQSAATVLHLDVPATAGTLLQRSARAARLGSDFTSVSVEVPVLAGCGDQGLLEQIQDPGADAAAADTLALSQALCGSRRQPAA